MRLWVERSERPNWWGSRTYWLTFRLIEVSAEELAMIGRHRLAAVAVWSSTAELRLSEAAAAAFDEAAATSGWRWASAKKGLRRNLYGVWLAWSAWREAAVTVGDLLAGKTLECGELGELLAAEAGIRDGFDGLAARLRALASYEAGEEMLVEPAADDLEQDGMPPERWARMVRR